MENLELVEKVVITPDRPTERRRLFLSNIDLNLRGYQESVCFFCPPTSQLTFPDVKKAVYSALGSLLVPYDFLAGRLVRALQEGGSRGRLEIDCNGAGIVVAVATTESELNWLGELNEPKPEYRQLTAFLFEEGEEEMDITDLPLLYFQLTQFGCGSLAIAIRYNHCTVDGLTVHDFLTNFAAVTRGDSLVIVPNPDRTIFRARDPPVINHPHFEFSKAVMTDDISARVATGRPCPTRPASIIHLPPERIAILKIAALRGGKLKACTVFHAVAAKIWKARTTALRIPCDRHSTMLFPVDIRKRLVPEVPAGFAGNAIIPGYARATAEELIDLDEPELVRRVQEGIERLDDGYVRSAIDWLEANPGGGHWGEDRFSVVAMFRLGLEEPEFAWGKQICNVPVEVKPGLVALLPGPREGGGINVWVDMDADQVEELRRILLND
ncbi:hypothetical protein CRG98_002751 [Punica granatum]|uniref:Omega-hydroxypalmitate O-feruloyl transferase n=1 Tax=Punica granatum TaxID=22663 RepID=A0A2I0L7U6_PUNGR|nr:hypothetical protein CRG98_002751 [Punica granatum]